MDVQVFYHQPGQFLHLDGRMSYMQFRGKSVQNQISYQQIKMSEKQISKWNPIAEEKKKRKVCSSSLYDECVYDAIRVEMLEKVGCVSPWVLPKKQYKVCTSSQANKWIKSLNNLGRDCPKPCEFMMINVGSKNVVDNYDESENGTLSKYALQYLYFATRIIVSEEHDLYTFLSLAAEIGGYVGLLLGVSFFHLARFLKSKIEGEKNQKKNSISSVVSIAVKPFNK